MEVLIMIEDPLAFCNKELGMDYKKDGEGYTRVEVQPHPQLGGHYQNPVVVQENPLEIIGKSVEHMCREYEIKTTERSIFIISPELVKVIFYDDVGIDDLNERYRGILSVEKVPERPNGPILIDALDEFCRPKLQS